MLTIRASQLRMFEGYSESVFRSRLESFIQKFLAGPIVDHTELDARQLMEKTMGLAKTFEFTQEVHIAELSVLLAAILCIKPKTDKQNHLFRILSNTREGPDDRIFQCANELGIIHPRTSA